MVRLLYERGYSREQVVELFNIIDWMIQLPEGLARGFSETVYAIEEEKKVAYVNSVVRYERQQAAKAAEAAMQLGRQEGRREALQSLLQLKFGELPQWAQQQLAQASEEQLNQWMAAIFAADSLEAMLGQH